MRDAVGGTLGQVGATEEPAGFDSFVTAATNGPIHVAEGGDGLNIQFWNPQHRRGFQFRPTVDVLFHGVRYWWSGAAHATRTVDVTLHLGAGAGGAAALATWPGYSGLYPSHQWTEHLLAEPVPIAAGATRIVWASTVTSGSGIDVPRTAGYFVDLQDSIGGLLDAIQPTARFDASVAGPTVPFATTDAWYWIDPLVTAA